MSIDPQSFNELDLAQAFDRVSHAVAHANPMSLASHFDDSGVKWVRDLVRDGLQQGLAENDIASLVLRRTADKSDLEQP